MSGDKDLAVNIAAIPAVGTISKKPVHLILVESTEGKTKLVLKFLSLDKPGNESNLVSAKGFFTEASEDEISKNYNEIISNTSKELYEEIMFPLYKIVRIKNLFYKAK